jgi:glucosyl-dolichyl phosphate glucuronosyltransferase
MKITVILCTYNRCQSLSLALDSVAASVLPPSVEWEVLVVDNNSPDKTREVIEEYCTRYPGRFRYLFEGKQGKSNALNSGIRSARGNVIAFMDDDVLVAPDWLQNLTAALDSGEWGGVGGRILSQQAVDAPKWLALDGPYDIGGMLALFDHGDKGFELKTPPFGTNMAFPARIFTQHGDFRTDMGPCPGSEIRNEDTEFGRRLMAGGEKLWYEPAAVVYHAIPPSRLQQDYLLRFWYDHGRAQIREIGPKPDIFGIPRWCFAIPKICAIILPQRTFKWLVATDPKRRFFFKGLIWMTFGQMVEMPRLWRVSRNASPGVAPLAAPSQGTDLTGRD